MEFPVDRSTLEFQYPCPLCGLVVSYQTLANETVYATHPAPWCFLCLLWALNHRTSSTARFLRF